MKKVPLNIVVLAAGRGTRMHSRLPKVLHPLGGRPMLAHVLDRAKDLKADRVVVVYGHGGEAVPAAFSGSNFEFVCQEPQLGTGHAVMQAEPRFLNGGSTLILYGDVPLLGTQTLRRLCDRPEQLRMLTATLDNPAGYGRIVREASGAIVRIVEEKDADATERRIAEINTGILCAPTASLRGWLSKITANNAQREYYLTDVVSLAVASGAVVSAIQPAAAWEILGVNSKDQLAHVERIYQLEQARALMRRGTTLADPWRFDLRGEIECGQDVFIDVNCVFEGTVRIADGAKIGAGCFLRDVTIGADSEIAPFSHLDGATIGSNCRVGPYARLRPGTKLEDESRVGNFVEVKASRIGRRSKANHLSYIGDTTVGKNVNIGAGTITCNYDGVNKHQTIIEDDAFIGSDTQLVAPVTIGRGATVGAGSTITRDAPPAQLTVSRSKQVSVIGWKRPSKQGKKID
jgi:bifunctional UDP-N-acetylglucosamine pyrophosphorylase / glucosamine-1-phosphate N-acetyltransferase